MLCVEKLITSFYASKYLYKIKSCKTIVFSTIFCLSKHSAPHNNFAKLLLRISRLSRLSLKFIIHDLQMGVRTRNSKNHRACIVELEIFTLL